jgi:hypothetical protein
MGMALIASFEIFTVAVGGNCFWILSCSHSVPLCDKTDFYASFVSARS